MALRTELISYYIGISLIVFLNLYVIAFKETSNHPFINLIGASLIAYYFISIKGYV